MRNGNELLLVSSPSHPLLPPRVEEIQHCPSNYLRDTENLLLLLLLMLLLLLLLPLMFADALPLGDVRLHAPDAADV
jgi:hypothetical protein